MNIQYPSLKSSHKSLTDNNLLMPPQPIYQASDSLCASPFQSSAVSAISPWEKFINKAKIAQIVDYQGNFRVELYEKYPMGELSEKEVQAIVSILKERIEGKHEITFTLSEYFSYLIDNALKTFNTNITSINFIGGILPSILKSYYIRNLNDIYKKQCLALGIDDEEDMVTGAVAADFDRFSPDTDILSTIDNGDLAQIINLGTRFFAEKLKTQGNINQKDKLIKDTFYHARTVLPDFSLVTFGPEDSSTDCNFVFDKNINQSLFLHHALRLDVLPLVIALRQENYTLNLLQLIPTHESCGGWEALFARACKKLICKNIPNNRALFAYYSNITIGYSPQDPNLGQKLYSIVENSKNEIDLFTLLKKKWEDHHFKEPLALIPLIFNAHQSLLENNYKGTESLWEKAMCWYDEEVLNLQNQHKTISNEVNSPFLQALRKVNIDKSIPQGACRDLLQVYGFLMHFSSQTYEPMELKGLLLPNSEGICDVVTISQKIQNKNYSISISINLAEALQTILKLSFEQMETLKKIALHLQPKIPYKLELIPPNLITDKHADDALKCLDHPHKAIQNLGYELLLVYALSTPKKWVLKELVKHLPNIIASLDKVDYFRLITNFEEALKGFPETLETHKIISPLLLFCEHQKKNSDQPLLKFCIAMALTNDPSLVHEAVRINVSDENAQLQNRIDFLKSLLPSQSAEAAKYFLKLQKRKLISDTDEIKLFNAISDEIRKKQFNPLNQLHLQSISDYATQLLQSKKHAKEVCLLMASAFLDQGLVEEAKKWFLPILKLTLKSDDPDAFFFVPQGSHFPLLSVDLPPNPIAALGVVLKLQDEELKLFLKLLYYQPRMIPNELHLIEQTYPKGDLINCADKCLKHPHATIKSIGFELLMVYARSFETSSKEAEIKFFTYFLGNLPVILSTIPESCEMFINGMRTILLGSLYAKYTDFYLSALQEQLQQKIKSKDLLKSLYLVNCNALAATNDETLRQISKNLFSVIYFKKLAPVLNEIDQIEIAFASISTLLTGNILLALEAFKMVEVENKSFKTIVNKSALGATRRNIYILLINGLINKNYIQLAKEQLLKALENQILVHESPETTETWLNLLNNALKHTNFGFKATVELWKLMKVQGKFLKTHSHQHVELMIELIRRSFVDQNFSYDDFIIELQTGIRSLTLSEEQLSSLNMLYIDTLKREPLPNNQRLKLIYPVFEKADLKWFESNKIDYLSMALAWLNASQNNPELHEEIKHLLVNVMKNFTTDSKDEIILAVYKILVKVLNSTTPNTGQISKDLKSLILFSHLRFCDLLQKALEVDFLYEYFYALSRHDFLDKKTLIFFAQSLWLSDKILKRDKKDPLKMEKLHNLIKPAFQKDFNNLQIDADKKFLPIKIATAFLKLQNHSLAKEWVEIVIRMQKSAFLLDVDLAPMYSLWCHAFLVQGQFQSAYFLFSVLCNLPNCPSDEVKAHLCFKISQAFLKVDSELSAQLLLEHWFMLSQIIPKPELHEHLKELIEIVLDKCKTSDQIKLFTSLIRLGVPSDHDFLFFQLQNFCKIVKFSDISSVINIQSSDIYTMLVSTFFPSLNIIHEEDINLQDDIDGSYQRIKFLIDNPVSVHYGITLLNEFLVKKLNVLLRIDSTPTIKMWAQLFDTSLRSWFRVKHLNFYSKLSSTFDSLFPVIRKLFEKLEPSEYQALETSLELCEIRNCFMSSAITIENSLTDYNEKIQKYSHNLVWIELSTSYLVDNILHEFIMSDDVFWFLKMHFRIIEILKKHSSEGQLLYLQNLTEKLLDIDLGDNQRSASVLYFASLCLENLTQQENLTTQKDLMEVVNLLETFFYKQLNVSSVEYSWNSKTKDSADEFYIPLKSNSFTLSADFFQACFRKLISRLENLNYDKTFPLEAVSFQLLVHNKMAPISVETEAISDNFSSKANEVTNDFSDDICAEDLLFNSEEIVQRIRMAISVLDLKVFKNVTLSNQLNAASLVIKKLYEQDNRNSSAKAVDILKNIPKMLWIQNSETEAQLDIILAKLIKDNNLYPEQIKNIIGAIVSLALFFKDQKRLESPNGLCIELLNKLIERGISEDIINQFISNCVKLDLFDKNNSVFVKIFSYNLNILLKIKPIDREVFLYQFISDSLAEPNHSSTKWIEIKTILLNCIDKQIIGIFSPDNAKLAYNLRFFYFLDVQGYLDSKGIYRSFNEIWLLFSTQFPVIGAENFTPLLRDLIYCRLQILTKWPCKTKNNQRQRAKMLNSTFDMISKNINNIILNDCNELKHNIDQVMMLFLNGYYKERPIENKNVLIMLGKHYLSLDGDTNSLTSISEESMNILLNLLKNFPGSASGEIKKLINELLKKL